MHSLGSQLYFTVRRQVGDHFSVGIEWFIVHRFVGPCGPCGSINALCALGLSCFRQIYGLSLGWVKAIAIASRIHYEGTTLFSRISYGSVSHEICSALPCSNISGLPWNFLEHSLSLNFLKKIEHHTNHTRDYKRNVEKKLLLAELGHAWMHYHCALMGYLGNVVRRWSDFATMEGNGHGKKIALRLQPRIGWRIYRHRSLFRLRGWQRVAEACPGPKIAPGCDKRPGYTLSHGFIFSPWDIPSESFCLFARWA